MRVWRHLAQLPLALKVPLLVAGLVVVVAFAISEVVVSRLTKDQEANLTLLANAYLDGLSAAALPAVVRKDVWETYDVLDRARGQYSGVEARYSIVELPGGAVLAASDPIRFPLHKTLPRELRDKFKHGDGLVIDDNTGSAWLTRVLRTEGVSVGTLLAEIDISKLLLIRSQVILTLVLVNGGLAFAFALIGYFGIRYLLRPVGVLTEYVDRIRAGEAGAIPEHRFKEVPGGFATLFNRFNAMAQAVSERETLASQLAEQERYALLGRLASGLAHEVNNPLGGMMNAVDTIQAHGHDPKVRATSLEFLKRGLAGIQSVVRATLVTYKGGVDISVLTPNDLDDLPFLIQHETGARRVLLEWRNQIRTPLPISGSIIRQITLNLLLNACAATPVGSKVFFDAMVRNGSLHITITDEGGGLPPEMAALLTSNAHAPRSGDGTKGLGLWTTARLVHRLHGKISIDRPTVGTRITVVFPMDEEAARDAA